MVVGDTNKLFVLMSYNKNKNNTLNSHSMNDFYVSLFCFYNKPKICGTKIIIIIINEEHSNQTTKEINLRILNNSNKRDTL